MEWSILTTIISHKRAIRGPQRAVLITDTNMSRLDKYVQRSYVGTDAFNKIMTGSRGTREHIRIFRPWCDSEISATLSTSCCECARISYRYAHAWGGIIRHKHDVMSYAARNYVIYSESTVSWKIMTLDFSIWYNLCIFYYTLYSLFLSSCS